MLRSGRRIQRIGAKAYARISLVCLKIRMKDDVARVNWGVRPRGSCRT